MTIAPNRWGRRLQPVNSAMRLPLYFAIFLCLSSPGQQANLPGPGLAKQNVASALPLAPGVQALKCLRESDVDSLAAVDRQVVLSV